MVKMVSLKAPKELEKGKEAPVVSGYPEQEGVAVHLEHRHLKKLGLADGSLKNGDKVEFHGAGHVERASSSSDAEGEHHTATLRLHRGALEHEMPEDGKREELREEVAKNYDLQTGAK